MHDGDDDKENLRSEADHEDMSSTCKEEEDEEEAEEEDEDETLFTSR